MSWVDDCQLRCRAALSSATTAADRGVLLRQWTWLHDSQVVLSTNELRGLDLDVLRARFGVIVGTVSATESLLTLATEGDSPLWPVGLREALKFDLRPRRPIHPIVGDGILRRRSDFGNYLVPTQKAAVRNIVAAPPASSLLVTMPTGSGKSLLFELAASWAKETVDERSCVVVVVPTVSLAHAHRSALRKQARFAKTEALTGDVGPAKREEILRAFRRGEIPILLMNPETAMRSARQTLIEVTRPAEERVGDTLGRLATLVIDEAHIVQSWGRTFRPDFQALPALVRALRTGDPDLRILLLSATIDEKAMEVLESGYGPLTQVSASVPRYELQLLAKKYRSATARDDVLLQAVDRLPRPAIIYTTTIEDTDRWLIRLKEEGYGRVGRMTGDSSSGERSALLRDWQDNAIDLVVATSAFGMGIDKADVRAVIHACLPENAARLYQEVGRAGRDGHAATGLCLWTDLDEGLAVRLATSDWLRPETAAERWVAMLKLCRAQGRLRRESGERHWILEVPLDAAPVRLGPHTGETHRGWNRSLLLMLIRAKKVDLLDVRSRDEVWVVRVLDERLLEPEEEPLASLFAVRDEEKEHAKEAFEELLNVLQDPEECLLQGVFELVDAARPATAACGHCTACVRSEQTPLRPESVVFGGLRALHPRPLAFETAAKWTGMVLVQSEGIDLSMDACRSLVEKVAALGGVQFVVPERFAELTATTLGQIEKNPGLVLTCEDVAPTRTRSAWTLLDIPTCVILPAAGPTAKQARLVDLLFRLRETRTAPLLVVGRPAQRVDGKPLGQQFARTYGQDFLEMT